MNINVNDNYIELLEKLVIELLSRLGQDSAYLPERKAFDDSKYIECKHDQFGAKFKFFIRNKEKNKEFLSKIP